MVFNYMTIVILGSLIYSAFVDLTKGKIQNKVVFIILLSGIIFFITNSKYNIELDNFIGLFLPFVLLIYFFKTKYIGGGDIKLFMSLGFIYGTNNILLIMFLTFLLASLFFITRKLLNIKTSNKLHLSIFILISIVMLYLYMICGGKSV